MVFLAPRPCTHPSLLCKNIHGCFGWFSIVNWAWIVRSRIILILIIFQHISCIDHLFHCKSEFCFIFISYGLRVAFLFHLRWTAFSTFGRATTCFSFFDLPWAGSCIFEDLKWCTFILRSLSKTAFIIFLRSVIQFLVPSETLTLLDDKNVTISIPSIWWLITIFVPVAAILSIIIVWQTIFNGMFLSSIYVKLCVHIATVILLFEIIYIYYDELVCPYKL